MIQYLIDKDNRIITAKFSKGWEERLLNTVNKRLMDMYCQPVIASIVNKILQSYEKGLFAKAKCNPEDVWDEEYGKMLAKQRLFQKWHNLLNMIYVKLQQYINKNHDKFNFILNKEIEYHYKFASSNIEDLAKHCNVPLNKMTFQFLVRYPNNTVQICNVHQSKNISIHMSTEDVYKQILYNNIQAELYKIDYAKDCIILLITQQEFEKLNKIFKQYLIEKLEQEINYVNLFY